MDDYMYMPLAIWLRIQPNRAIMATNIFRKFEDGRTETFRKGVRTLKIQYVFNN